MAFASLFRRIRAWMSRDRFHAELEEEMALHRDLEARDLQAEGMAADSARHEVHRRFGNSALLEERSTDVVSFGFETTLQDLRYALRQLRRSPTFGLVAVTVLALATAASVSIFAFVDAALIRPLPYRDPNRLVSATGSVPTIHRADLSYPDYLDFKRLNTVFESLDVHNRQTWTLKTPKGTEMIRTGLVSAGFFRTLGVAPILGRDFHDGEDADNAPRTLLLTYPTWQTRFGGREDVLGQTLNINDTLYTVIGVLPRDFEFAPRSGVDVWAPLHPSEDNCMVRRGCHGLVGVARLKPGVTIDAAAANMKTIASQLEQQYPDTNRDQTTLVEPLADVIVGDVRPVLLALLAGSGLLLLIACVNVGSLLLLRSEGRQREIAVRSALGASPLRLVRQFCAESIVLVSASAAVGIGLAALVLRAVPSLVPPLMLATSPFLSHLQLAPHVLWFAGAIAAIAALVFTAAPAIRVPSRSMRDGLAAGGRAAGSTAWRRFGSNLVAAELAIAMVLLVCAGLLGKSLMHLMDVNLGFDPQHLATLAVVSIPQPPYTTTPKLIDVRHRIIERVEALPGVRSVTLVSKIPVTGNGDTEWVRVEGAPYHGEHNEVNERDVSPAYFQTVGARLIRGRWFTDADESSATHPVIINQTFVRKFFSQIEPLGHMIGDPDLAPSSMKEVIGVVEDIREADLDDEIMPAMYTLTPSPYFSLIAQTSLPPDTAASALATAVHEIDPQIGTIGSASMTRLINNSAPAYLHRSSAWVVGGFAAMALLLGVVGLYGVIAYSVTQRTREIGVRMALGAQRSAVYGLVLRGAAVVIVVGLTAGLIASFGAAALIRNLLFGVKAWDLPTLAAMAGLLLVCAMLASFVPARRAASVNPTDALRAE